MKPQHSQNDESLFERIMASLPGWMLLLAGCAMVACITLMSPWLEVRKLQWQSDVMALQASQLTSQQVSYEQFLTALREEDPVVIERMAYYHLRLKPDEAMTLPQLHQAMLIDQGRLSPADAAKQSQVWQTLPTIEDLLGKPMYKPAQFCPAGVIPDTRLVRLTTGEGPGRYVLGGLGALCLFFGLLPPSSASASTTGTAAAAAMVGTALLRRRETLDVEAEDIDEYDEQEEAIDEAACDEEMIDEEEADDEEADDETRSPKVMTVARETDDDVIVSAEIDTDQEQDAMAQEAAVTSRVVSNPPQASQVTPPQAGEVIMVSASTAAAYDGLRDKVLKPSPASDVSKEDPQVAQLFAAAQAALQADMAADEAAMQAATALNADDEDAILTAELDETSDENVIIAQADAPEDEAADNAFQAVLKQGVDQWRWQDDDDDQRPPSSPS